MSSGIMLRIREVFQIGRCVDMGVAWFLVLDTVAFLATF